MNPWPLLTADLPGTRGLIKQRLEDFLVEEQPLYEPGGEGTHVYFRVVKRGITTPEAVSRIARHLNKRPNQIGYAGLKDAQAVTSQWMSVEHVDEKRLAAFSDSRVRIVATSRHTNKLRMGHLSANRFRIRIRDAGPEQLPPARAVLDVIIRRGAPNYFGPQRFGARGDTALLGQALAEGDLERFVQLFLGGPRPDDPPPCRAARDAFEAGDLGRALQRWPRHCRDQRRALAAYKKKREPAAAVSAIDKRMKRLYVSALQSGVFNDILARRLAALDRVMTGDVAQKVPGGGMFVVADAQGEQPRCDRFEISPTGLLPGSRPLRAGGEPARIERDAMRASGVTEEMFDKIGSLRMKGARRALRFPAGEVQLDAGQDEHGSFLQIAFTCPPGSYATVLLAEIMKTDPPPG